MEGTRHVWGRTIAGMRHVWGWPSDENGRPDDSWLDPYRRTPHFCGVEYCIRCKQVFCEHCLGPEMFNRNDCSGTFGSILQDTYTMKEQQGEQQSPS